MSQTPFEPYVADPQEPRLPPRAARLQPSIVLLIGVILAATAAWLFIDFGQEQDPALDAPIHEPTQP